MKHSLILWSSALLLTFLTGYIQSGTSEYYPVTGTIGIDEKKVSYRFEKFFNDKDDYRFIIRTDNPDIQAVVKWKKTRTSNIDLSEVDWKNEEKWKMIEMKNNNDALIANIPKQNAGEIILYFAEIYKDGKKYIVPDKPVTLLFQGYVPSMISFLSNFALFGGLLLSYRTGLSALGGFNENQKIKKLTLFTVALFFVYTIAVTPLRKSYELNAINNKVIPITSLFDIQSILLFLLWIAAMVIVFKVKNPKRFATTFAVLTALVFLFIKF
jgi:hypothetical protein